MSIQTSIDTLEISVRSRGALDTLGIETVEELAVTPDHVLLTHSKLRQENAQ
jgi:DNA-directed RNA polymerase alpha subunit